MYICMMIDFYIYICNLHVIIYIIYMALTGVCVCVCLCVYTYMTIYNLYKIDYILAVIGFFIGINYLILLKSVHLLALFYR